jgi:hypothetical protein
MPADDPQTIDVSLKALASLVSAAVTEADLRGKDYFTLEEACRFCGLGETAFREP